MPIHRDSGIEILKPQNILVGSFGDAYVADWGLVSVRPGQNYKLNLPRILVEKTGMEITEDRLLDETDSAITAQSGAIVGTPGYMAPEQCTGVDFEMGAVSDVWAFGIMLFESLTDQHPFKRGDRDATIRATMSAAIPAPSKVKPDVPLLFDELCGEMLVRQPKKRMQFLDDFVDEVASYLKGAGAGSMVSGTHPTASTIDLPVLHGRAESEELARQKRKTELLIELVRLNLLQWRRKRELWTEIAVL